MPVYDYRCPTCDEVFERRTTIAGADDVRCPEGHAVKRLLPVFSVAGRASASPVPAPAGGGGCCGGACGCG